MPRLEWQQHCQALMMAAAQQHLNLLLAHFVPGSNAACSLAAADAAVHVNSLVWWPDMRSPTYVAIEALTVTCAAFFCLQVHQECWLSVYAGICWNHNLYICKGLQHVSATASSIVPEAADSGGRNTSTGLEVNSSSTTL